MTDKDINNLPAGTETAEAGTVAKIETVAPAEKGTAEDEAKTGIIYNNREEIYKENYIIAFSSIITELLIVLNNVGNGNDFIEFNQNTQKTALNENGNVFDLNKQTGTLTYAVKNDNLTISIELLEYVKFENINKKKHLTKLFIIILASINEKCIINKKMVNDTVTCNLTELYKLFNFKNEKQMEKAFKIMKDLLPKINIKIKGSLYQNGEEIDYNGVLFQSVKKIKQSYSWNIRLANNEDLQWNKILPFYTLADIKSKQFDSDTLNLYLYIIFHHRRNLQHKTYNNNTSTISIKKFCLENGISLNTKNIGRDVTEKIDNAINNITDELGEYIQLEYVKSEDNYKNLKEFVEQGQIKYSITGTYKKHIETFIKTKTKQKQKK